MISQRPLVFTGYDEPEGDRFDQPSISLDEIAAFFEVDRSTARDWLYDAGISPLVFLHRGELTLRYCPYAIDNWLQSECPSQRNTAL